MLMKQIRDLSITQVVQAGKIIEELFLDWNNYPSLSEDDAGSTSKVSTGRVHARGALKLGAPSTDSKTQHKVSSCSVPHVKKVKTSATEIFSDSDLSNSIDSYRTC